MIEVIVSLNGLEFDLRVPGAVYNGDLPDFSQAVEMALQAYRLRFPLEPLDIPSLVVTVERAFTETAARDGVGVDVASPSDPANLSEAELDELTAPDEPVLVEDYSDTDGADDSDFSDFDLPENDEREYVSKDAVNEDGEED